MMIFINHMTKAEKKSSKCLKPFVQTLAPFAPHLSEELWKKLGETAELSYAPWPSFDPALAKDDVITIAIQVMGKTRGTVEVEPGTDQQAIEKLAREIPSVAQQIQGKQIRKVIFVPGKIMNLVVG
jgi:leucyl-tRNA synthetase